MSRGWLRPVLVAACVLAYPPLQHYANITPALAPFGAGLAVLPLLGAWLLLAWRSSRPKLSLILAALIAALVLYRWWPRIQRDFPLLFMLQEAGAYLTLAVTFGRSLHAGRAPLCTLWARVLHGILSAEALRYTRSVTLAWALFFVAISLSSVTLYALAPLRIWSFFSNFLTLPLAALMFAIEYEIRRRRLPGMQHASIADTARVYFTTMRNGTAARW